MLTPVHRLRAEIAARQAETEVQKELTQLSLRHFRYRWHKELASRRNLALSFGAGLTYGLLRTTRVALPGRTELWGLVRPLLVSSAMAWWGSRQGVKSELENMSETGAI
ncbi:MAG: hypothetical protein RBS88_12045 [Spongiibacteraceae bacterium]|jgi:hypothetical protein|nr:hypothetical protein [Spongiibacteraceae bacterium]